MKEPGPNIIELLKCLTLDFPMVRQPLDVHPRIVWPAHFVENFDGAFNWKEMPTYCTGTDYVIEAHADAALIGDKGLHMKTRATDPAVNDGVGCYRHACMGPCNFIRYQGAQAFSILGVTAEQRCWVFFVEGVLRWKAGVSLYTSGRVDYLASDGLGHELTELKAVTTVNSWNKYDFMVDVKLHKYVYLAVNGVRHWLTEDVQQYGTWDDTSLALDHVLYTRDAAIAGCYTDQLLVTGHHSKPLPE